MSLLDFWKKKTETVQPDIFEIVTLNRIHEIVNPLVMELLANRGFEAFTRVVWVNSKPAPIRQIFGFVQWKGGKFAPRWGLSLDFVPHISSNSIRWHRTPKSAQFDLLLDARDPELDIYYTKGPQIIIEQAPMVVKKSIALADEFWSRFTSIADLPKAVKMVEEEGLWLNKSYMANAFVFAINGRLSEGNAELEKFFKMHRTEPPLRHKLQELLEKVSDSGK